MLLVCLFYKLMSVKVLSVYYWSYQAFGEYAFVRLILYKLPCKYFFHGGVLINIVVPAVPVLSEVILYFTCWQNIRTIALFVWIS